MLNTTTSNLENIEGYIWFNGTFIKWQDAKIHVLTHSLHYSGGVFEGEKSYNGKIFRINEHTARLFRSASLMKLEIPYTKEEIIQASVELLLKNNLQNAYVRPLVWRSTEALMVKPVNPIVNVMIAAWEPRKKPSLNPLNLVVGKWRRPPENSHPVQCKSSSQYAMFTLAIIEANEIGYDDALLLDQDDHIAECTTSNIFFIKGNELYTPKIKYCLNGITRQTTIAIASNLGIKIYEQDIRLDDIHSFDGCFVTGTAIGLKDIGSIAFNEEKKLFDTNDLYNSLKSEYLNLVNGK